MGVTSDSSPRKILLAISEVFTSLSLFYAKNEPAAIDSTPATAVIKTAIKTSLVLPDRLLGRHFESFPG